MPATPLLLPDCVTLEEAEPGYPIFRVRHAAAEGSVAQHGAHVMEWTPAGQSPVLYLSPQAVLTEGKPIRGGIPICWPWFNANPADASLPMHGFVRTRRWQVEDIAAEAGGVRFVFTLSDDAATRQMWPHRFALRAELFLGATLRLSLTTTNLGEAAFHLTEALHSYLCVRDITQVTVRGLAGIGYLDTVGTHTMRQQEGEIVIDREVDRQYDSPSAVLVDDPAGGRILRIDKAGSGTTVVWNPWIEKSKRLTDLPDDAYPGFLCVEAANTASTAVEVAPGASHTISTDISVV